MKKLLLFSLLFAAHAPGMQIKKHIMPGTLGWLAGLSGISLGMFTTYTSWKLGKKAGAEEVKNQFPPVINPSENPELALEFDQFLRKQCKKERHEHAKKNNQKDKLTRKFVEGRIPDDEHTYQALDQARKKRDRAHLDYLICREKAAQRFKPKI